MVWSNSCNTYQQLDKGEGHFYDPSSDNLVWDARIVSTSKWTHFPLKKKWTHLKYENCSGTAHKSVPREAYPILCKTIDRHSDRGFFRTWKISSTSLKSLTATCALKFLPIFSSALKNKNKKKLVCDLQALAFTYPPSSPLHVSTESLNRRRIPSSAGRVIPPHSQFRQPGQSLRQQKHEFVKRIPSRSRDATTSARAPRPPPPRLRCDLRWLPASPPPP